MYAYTQYTHLIFGTVKYIFSISDKIYLPSALVVCRRRYGHYICQKQKTETNMYVTRAGNNPLKTCKTGINAKKTEDFLWDIFIFITV